jgi:hypothetical protein
VSRPTPPTSPQIRNHAVAPDTECDPRAAEDRTAVTAEQPCATRPHPTGGRDPPQRLPDAWYLDLRRSHRLSDGRQRLERRRRSRGLHPLPSHRRSNTARRPRPSLPLSTLVSEPDSVLRCRSLAVSGVTIEADRDGDLWSSQGPSTPTATTPRRRQDLARPSAGHSPRHVIVSSSWPGRSCRATRMDQRGARQTIRSAVRRDRRCRPGGVPGGGGGRAGPTRSCADWALFRYAHRLPLSGCSWRLTTSATRRELAAGAGGPEGRPGATRSPLAGVQSEHLPAPAPGDGRGRRATVRGARPGAERARQRRDPGRSFLSRY